MRQRALFPLLSSLFLLLSLTACSVFDSGDDKIPPLEGQRISVMELQKALEPDETTLETEPFVPPAPWNNEFWPQAGGYPNHSMQNLAFTGGQPKRIWRADIGQGTTSRFPLTAQPIIVGNQIFTLDTDFNLTAFNTKNGKENWSVEVESQFEDDPVISGGIAYGENLIYVTNGYNEVLALSPKNGDILWRKTISTPSRAAPTVLNGRVFITTLDNRVIALNSTDGAMLWEYIGITEIAGLVGAASPAASRDTVIPVFSSGEITALRAQNGSVIWSDNLARVRQFGGLTSLSDIKALPVIDEDLVFAISFSGRLVAIDLRTGTRVWQRDIGGSHTPWVAGNNLFVLSSENDLVALNRENGTIRWVNSLPKYRDPDDRDDPLFWTGPIMAGGRLLITSTNGKIMEINADSGQTLRTWETGESAHIPPILAGGTLYILSEDGTLSAYR